MSADRDDLAERIVSAAAALIAHEGPSALTARRLARSVDTSTMTIYTRFGSMEQVRVAVRRAGFDGLLARLAHVPNTEDPVADLTGIGYAYCAYAREHPQLYRATFFEATIDGEDASVAADAFAPLVAAVERCLQAGRFAPADPVRVAFQLWTAVHGLSALLIAGPLEPAFAGEMLAALARTLFIGLGDGPELAERSIAAARSALD